MSCPQYENGIHIYHPGKRQIASGDGTRYHPTVKESWRPGLFCLCGAECPPSEEPAVRAALAETERVRRLAWGAERAEQGRLL